MKNTAEDIERLKSELQQCQKTLSALGDENRQYLLCKMLGGKCGGSRVIELAEQTHLSRPAVSHHFNGGCSKYFLFSAL